MKPYRELFMLCRNCNRLAHASCTNVWIVDIMQCRCVFLEAV